MPSVYDYRHIELDRIGSGKKRLNTPVFRGEDTQSRLFGGSPPESPRRLSTSSVGSGINVSPGFLIKASHQKSNIFSTDPVPAVRSPVNGNVPMSPGRMIKESQRRSNIFPQQPGQSPTSFHSSAASSTADLTGSEAGAGTPVRSVASNGNGIAHMSPGRLIKASQQRSNIFPQTDSSRNSSSASSSVDLAESENGRSLDSVHADILHH